MRRIASAAEARGLTVERILCSADPRSLDAVIIPRLGLAFADGTAPHTMDCSIPAADSLYIDLGKYYDSAALRPRREEIAALMEEYRSLYTAAYSHLTAAAAALPRAIPGLWGRAERAKLRRRAEGLFSRELRGCEGESSLRFISALGCHGRLLLEDSLAPYPRLWLLDNRFGLGNAFLEELENICTHRGTQRCVCRDSLDPQLISALCFPGCGIALLAPEPFMSCSLPVHRRMRLDALPERETLAAARALIRRGETVARGALELAGDTLCRAGELHDELEAIYNPHVDFDGVYTEAESLISEILI